MNGFSALSVVVPVGQEEQAWSGLLKQLSSVLGEAPEIILSACRPLSGAIELPENVSWLQVEQGRGHQLNAGARKASRRVIWFLHADTIVDVAVADAIERYLVEGKSGLGYFRLGFADDGPALTRLNAGAANLRSRWLGLPFGDQGFIVEKAVFERLKGYDESVSPGEDLDFVVRAKAAGIVLNELPALLTTSARRYRKYGWLATTLKHIWLTWCLNRQAGKRLRVAR